ncbi:hypothetical protein SAMN05421802_11476 [Corynebacterium afermentans]|uniref:Uncharacterized protein n=1 Tax=Corynebacterium afermentans TaxID=38286 RepID=A0A9X8R5C3_9CORY|nr:hypothetical protein SAMN05421802_11476 [Corynebacterium afermentans]
MLCLARTHLARLRIADNTRYTNYWRLPTKVRGAIPPCGQPHPHPSLVHTNQFRARASLRIADNHGGTHHWRTPIKSPRRNHPAGRDLPTRGHIGRGDSTRSHDDADSGAKVEYRTSSTPAYTDGLDLHYSTNNAPTTTQVRSTLRIADNPRCTHHWRTPMKTPGRNHPAGRDLPTRGHIGRGDSSNDDAYCGTKVEYRTSSTPAYTDELDLHYSTNNAPMKAWGRARLRIADNCACTNNGYPPTKAWAPPKPALRTTTAAPIIGPRTRMLSPALPAPVPHEPAGDRSIAPTEFSTHGNRGARAPRGSSWIAPRARLSCGRALAWTTGPGGSTSGPR